MIENSSQLFLDKIKTLAQEVSEREGCTLYDVEMLGQGSGRILRVYIDRYSSSADSPQPESNSNPGTGASIDDCANVSRGLGLLLDVEEIIPGGAYELEVSTPGLERILREQWHFEKAIGQNVQINTNEPIESLLRPGARKAPKSVVGLLTQVTEDSIKVHTSENEVEVEIQRPIIHKAKIKYVFETPHPKKGGSKPKKRKSKR